MKVLILLSIFFSFLCSAQAEDKNLSNAISFELLKISKEKHKIKNIIKKDDSLYSVNVVIGDNNKTKEISFFYNSDLKYLLFGEIYKNGERLVKKEEHDNNISDEIASIKKTISASNESRAKKLKSLIGKYTDKPIELLETVKQSKDYIIINKDGKRGEVLLVLSLSCSACKTIIQKNTLEKLISKGFSLILYFPASDNNSKKINDKISSLVEMPDVLSVSEKLARVRKSFKEDYVVSTSKNIDALIDRGNSFYKKELISGFPAVVVVGSFKENNYYIEGLKNGK